MRISDTSTGLGHSGFQPSVLSSKSIPREFGVVVRMVAKSL